jgi:hypothetical protein
LAQLDRLLELAHLSFGRIAKTNCADNNTKRSLPLKPKPQVRIPIVRDRSVQFDVITSSDSY